MAQILSTGTIKELNKIMATVPGLGFGDLLEAALQEGTGEGVAGITVGTGLAIDNTDPKNPIISSTGDGSGDMLAEVYDPNGVEDDCFDTDNHVDGTTNKVFTAIEKTLLSALNLTAKNVQIGSTYAPVLSDANKLIQTNVADANSMNISKSTTTNFSIGTKIIIQQIGLGKTTIVPAVDVTVNSLGGLLGIAGQFGVVTLIKTATDTWEAFGDLIA